MTDSGSVNVRKEGGAVELLTSRQRSVIVALTLLVAATRFLAVSRSMWDWDEALFAATLHHYDVVQHHPHPPGFPLFFALANIARFFTHDDFHALRAVSTLASLFVFPAMFSLVRSLGFRFRTCLVAALLFAFLPNVWYWGGTGFTDELALVTALAAAAFLFRGDSSRRSYLAGCTLLAATILVRAQNVLLAWPWIVASWRRRGERRLEVVAGAALIVILVLTGYGIAAQLTGVREYVAATRFHQHYVATVDGMLNPVRPSMRALFYDFAFDPFRSWAQTWGSRAVSLLMITFMLAAFLRPRRAHLHVILTFLPNFLLAWIFLSVTGISRLSLGYIALNAILAADGMDAVATLITSRLPVLNRQRLATVVQALLAAVIIGRYIFWVWPALEEVRVHDSPPVQALHWIGKHVPPGRTVYVCGAIEPLATYFLAPRYRVVPLEDDFDPSRTPLDAGGYVVADHDSSRGAALNFHRTHRRLWALFNQRYFEASVAPAAGWVTYGKGWYGEEISPERVSWRWMGEESHTSLGPLPGPALLGIDATVRSGPGPRPQVTIVLDGRVLDRFVPIASDVRRVYAVQSRGNAPDELVIQVVPPVNLLRIHRGTDSRDLGLQLHRLVWKSP